MSDFPEIDATKQDAITNEQARFFRENGLLMIRNLLCPEELKALQDQTAPLVERAMASEVDDVDFMYKPHALTGRKVPFRVEYVIERTAAGKALLGHPFILRSIEKLQGPNFLPTWDSMVFKGPGQGAAIPWHRDAGPYIADDVDQDVAAINVDFYLDGSDATNCLWGIPGSNRWTHQQACERIAQLNGGGDGDTSGSFLTDGAVPLPVNPGDVLFHNILAIHGSPAAESGLRRVLYYEFRPIDVERRHGPHKLEYIPLKQKVLDACLAHRRDAPYAAGETPFVYRADDPARLAEGETLKTYRYPHQKFWREPAAV